MKGGYKKEKIGKKKPSLKRNRRNFDSKFQDEVVDFFPKKGSAGSKNKEKADDDMMFNVAPVLKSQKEKKTDTSKKAKKLKTEKGKKSKSLFFDSEEEEFEQMARGVTASRPEDDIFIDENPFFSSYKQDLVSQFSLNKSDIKKMTKISKLKLSAGTLVLGAIGDKGINGKYLIINMTRSSQAFVSYNDISESNRNFDIKDFEIGEFIIGAVLPNEINKKVQISLKPSIVNRGLVQKEILLGQILPGLVKTEEDYGWKIEFFGENETTGFVKKTPEHKNIVAKKPYIFQITGLSQKGKILSCEFLKHVTSSENLRTPKLKDSDELSSGFNFENLLQPGNIHKVVVTKILENGLVVKFLDVFYGFIFEDHVDKPIAQYKTSDKFEARIITTNLEERKIYLSCKQNIICLKELNETKASLHVGKSFKNGFIVKKAMYGGSFLVDIVLDEMDKSSVLSALLPKKHIDEDNQEGLEEGNKKELNIKVKDYNYFEQIPIVTIKKEFLEKKILGWLDIKVGEIYKGVIEKIIRKEGNQINLIISLAPKINGFLDYLNLSDNPTSFPWKKKLNEGQAIKVRVLAVDPVEKKIKLTAKPTLLNQETEILLNFEDALKGNCYNGYITGELTQGFLVTFFNNITGMLPLKEIEENGIEKGSFKIGQTVKVFITYANSSTKKIGLALNSKGDSDLLHEKKVNTLESLKLLDLSNDQEICENLYIGDVFDYKIDKKSNISGEDKLVLISASKEKRHRAFVVKEHLTDFPANCEKLLEIYRKSKKLLLKGRIISKESDNNIIVTCKASIVNMEKFPYSQIDLQENHLYLVYVLQTIRKGVLVKFHEGLKALANNDNLDTSEDAAKNQHYQPNKTFMALVKKNDINKNRVYCTLKTADIYEGQSVKKLNSVTTTVPLMEFFNEEYLWTRKAYSNSIQKWNSIKIGNYLEGTISLIKDYGLILNIGEEKTGFLMNNNLLRDKGKYKLNDKLLCRVLDIDYDKGIFDLNEVDPKHLGKEKNELLENTECNLYKINSGEFLKKKAKNLSGHILLVKEHYLIVNFETIDNILCMVQTKNFNECFDISERYQNGMKLKNINIINMKNLKETCAKVYEEKIKDEIHLLNKINYMPLGEIRKSKLDENEGMEIEGETNKKSKKDTSLRKKLKVGLIVDGTVTSIKKTNVFVSLQENLFARIHKTQFPFDPETNLSSFEDYKVGDKLRGKIINIFKSDNLFIDLTLLEKHMTLPDGEINESAMLPQSHDLLNMENYNTLIGMIYPGIIKSISKDSINPFYIEISNENYGYCSIFDDIVSTIHCDKLNSLEEHFTAGKVYEFVVKSVGKKETSDKKKHCVTFELCFRERENYKFHLEVGVLCVAKILKPLKKSLRVQIRPEVFGSVDVMEISDEWLAEPLNYYKSNKYVKARIISINNEKNTIELSLRESVTDEKNWRALSTSGTTLQYKKAFTDYENNGDLRARVYKLGGDSLKVGMLFIGYINETNDKGCFIKVGGSFCVRASLGELNDIPVENPRQSFPTNRLVIGRIIKKHEDGKVDASLKESVIKYGYSLTLDNLKFGMTVEGTVTGYLKDKAIVSINGCRFRGLLKVEDHLDEISEGITRSAQKYLPLGTNIKAKIIKYKKEPKVKIKLGTKKKFFSELNESENQTLNIDISHVSTLIDSIRTIVKESLGKQNVASEITLKSIQIEDEKREIRKNKEEEFETASEADPEVEEEDSEDDNFLKKLQKEMHEENEQEIEEKDDDEIVSDFNEEEENKIDSEDNQEQEENQKNKKGKKKTQQERQQKEEIIRKQEEKLLNNENEPENSDDFEKLILRNPNSSYFWIRYVAFKLSKEGLEAARQTLERALRTINFRNENEKLNLWTSYLNLEHSFGSEKNLIKVFERALAANNPKRVYFKLIEIYRNAGKAELLEELCKNMVKKFKKSGKCWLEYIKTLFFVRKSLTNNKGKETESDKLDTKKVLERALQSLVKRKHIKLITHYARLEFIEGDAEKGRTLFEAILTNYPKRTDIWSMYLDLEIKHGTKESIRNMLERCLTLDLNHKKMKFFFQRYLQYEISLGDEERIEYVKRKATEYVQSIQNEQSQMELE